MTLDLTTEEDNVLARLKTLAGGRVFDYIPDDQILETETVNGITTVKPYITVNFGEPFPLYRDRAMAAGEDGQPHTWVWSATAWGATTAHTRPISRAIRMLMIGWSPNPGNTSELRARGGGSFSDRDTAARPTKSTRLLSFEAETNLAA